MRLKTIHFGEISYKLCSGEGAPPAGRARGDSTTEREKKKEKEKDKKKTGGEETDQLAFRVLKNFILSKKTQETENNECKQIKLC